MVKVVVTVAVVVALVAGVATATSRATAPGKNGRIAFRRYFTDDRTWGAVFTVNPDGTDMRQVTHPHKGIIDEQPDWAPDGSLLAFQRCYRASGTGCSVYTVRPDGSGLTRISVCPPGSAAPRCTDDTLPAFSPDGRSLVFGANTDATSDIVVTDLATHTQRDAVAATPAYSVDDPQFSPDGTHLVFERMQRGDGPRALFAADLSGANVRRLTAWTLNAGDNPDWSPDGRWILFRTHELHDGRQSQVDVIHPDGSGLRQLTHFKSGAIVTSSSFSPDGQSIVYGTDGLGGNADLYVMRADGSDIHRITRTKTWESTPDWGPTASYTRKSAAATPRKPGSLLVQYIGTRNPPSRYFDGRPARTTRAVRSNAQSQREQRCGVAIVCVGRPRHIARGTTRHRAPAHPFAARPNSPSLYRSVRLARSAARDRSTG